MNLEKLLIEYKHLSEQIILEAKSEGNIQPLLEMRQAIINNVDSLQYSKEQFINIANSLGLMELEKELTLAIAKEKNELRTKLDRVRKTKLARNMYENSKVKSNAFYAKI